jgi:hypothetical protein
MGCVQDFLYVAPTYCTPVIVNFKQVLPKCGLSPSSHYCREDTFTRINNSVWIKGTSFI